MKDRIKEMLGRGIPAVNVALAVGCDESYISQLMSDEVFAGEVQAAKAATFDRYAEQDDSLDDAEAKALKKVQQLVPFITRPAEAVRVFQVLNAAKRRTQNGATLAQQQASTIVNISLPNVARVTMLADHNKQVIEVDGRPLITMPAKELVQRTEDAHAARLLTASVPRTLGITTTILSEQL